MPSNALLEIINRLNGKVIISSEVSDEELSDIEIEPLVAHIAKHFEGSEGALILDKTSLSSILAEMKIEKEPMQIEVLRTDFKPFAKEIEPDFDFRNAKLGKVSAGITDFVDHFNDRFMKLSEMIHRHSLGNGFADSIESTKKYMSGREFTLVGMVYDKFITKNGHVLVTLEDRTGIAKVLFYKSDARGNAELSELYEAARRIAKDDVIAVKGKNSGPFVIASRILFPDIPVHTRKESSEDAAIAFISDTHIGSRYFMEEHFGKLLKWLNGSIDNRKDLASKVKYLIVGGDLVDGVGVYPRQDRELTIADLNKQYSIFFDFMESVPEYIETFIMTGNHDGVQRAEPQPQLSLEFLNGFSKDNMHIVTNPCYMRLHGVKVLTYHGTSLDSVIHSIPGCSYSEPEKGMKELLKRRHLSPIYGGNIIIPTKFDSMIIDEVPDILHMGHIHKNGYDEYHGTTIINSGTWQSTTDFQIKQGHVPTPALLPVYETKSMQTSLINFNTGMT